jgi:type IV pilus assembly protein PilX
VIGAQHHRTRPAAAAQRGVALISAMLLLIIITILALSMFRSFPTQEKIAGNVREKERAFHAANSALQFAEWWLTTNVATGDVVCGTQAVLLNGNINEGQICANALYTLPGQPAGLIGSITNLSAVPWTVGGTLIGTQYIPNGMTTQYTTPLATALVGGAQITANDSSYFTAPIFYIADLGGAGDAQGEVYQIDAYAYGGSASTVAVVESIYEIAQGVSCATCN